MVFCNVAQCSRLERSVGICCLHIISIRKRKVEGMFLQHVGTYLRDYTESMSHHHKILICLVKFFVWHASLLTDQGSRFRAESTVVYKKFLGKYLGPKWDEVIEQFKINITRTYLMFTGYLVFGSWDALDFWLRLGWGVILAEFRCPHEKANCPWDCNIKMDLT